MLYIYKIFRTDGFSWENYSDAVVVASSADDAKYIHPDKSVYPNGLKGRDPYEDYWYGWPTDLKKVNVELLAEYYGEDYKAGDVICASYHAG